MFLNEFQLFFFFIAEYYMAISLIMNTNDEIERL